MSTPAREICFVALARRTDNVVLAHRTHVKKNEYDFLAKVHLILSSPGWKGITNDKISLEDDGFNIYISIDEVSVEKPVPKGNILRNNVPQYDSPLIF